MAGESLKLHGSDPVPLASRGPHPIRSLLLIHDGDLSDVRALLVSLQVPFTAASILFTCLS